MARADIMIISDQAEAYAACLAELADEGIGITVCADAEQAKSAWSGEAILLGEPHLVSAAWSAFAGVDWIQSTWAGVTPLLPLAREGVTVTGVKGVFGAQMAEFCLGYLLAHELDVIGRYTHQQQRRWDARPTGGLAGKTLGVMGTGSIGTAIARAAAAFELQVLGFSRTGAPVEPFSRVYDATQLSGFLAGLDYLVCILPDTPATRGLLDRAAFNAMRPGCYLVNVGRGTLIEERALLEALSSGRLGGAVLDVFDAEPLPTDHPLWRAGGVRITGHVAAHSYPEDIARLFLRNYRRYTQGLPLQYRVDPARGY